MVVLNLSVLTSVRRIVKIAVRFLHTKTALCDRKDTQSRFAANAARSIVCVETCSSPVSVRWQTGFNAARSIVCVETKTIRQTISDRASFNAAHSIVCVETTPSTFTGLMEKRFNAARSIVCVETG